MSDFQKDAWGTIAKSLQEAVASVQQAAKDVEECGLQVKESSRRTREASIRARRVQEHLADYLSSTRERANAIQRACEQEPSGQPN